MKTAHKRDSDPQQRAQWTSPAHFTAEVNRAYMDGCHCRLCTWYSLYQHGTVSREEWQGLVDVFAGDRNPHGHMVSREQLQILRRVFG